MVKIVIENTVKFLTNAPADSLPGLMIGTALVCLFVPGLQETGRA